MKGGIGSEPAKIKATFDLVVRYVKQETLGPLKSLGKFAGFAIAGSMSLAIGFVLLMLGVLRLFQDETGSSFHGHLTWIPYLLTLVVGVVLLAVSFVAILKRKSRAPSA